MSRVLPLLILMVTTGCSRMKLAYDWMDWMLQRQARQYLDMTDDQAARADADIDAYLAWQRATMLPRYAHFLREHARLAAEGPLSPSQLENTERALHELLQETMTPMLDRIAELLVEQRGAQIDSLERALAERQEEMVEEASQADEKRLARLQDDYEERFSGFVGELRDDQRRRLESQIRMLHADPGPYLTERARRNRVMTTSLQRGADRVAVATELRRWWLGEPDPGAPAAYGAYRQQFNASLRGMIFDLVTSLDAAQRRTLSARLGAYAQDCEDLAGTR